jgi:hypothetical protein
MGTIYTIGDLRNVIQHLDDNDAFVVEINEGERSEDLYTGTIDIINNIQLTDGTTIKEVRLCI